MSLLPVGFGSQGGGYTIENSLRLRSSASAYLSWTPASAGNRKTWTWSGWVKRGQLSGSLELTLFGSVNPGVSQTTINFNNDSFTVSGSGSGLAGIFLKTSSVYRDPSAWYHIVVAVDTTQATASNRVKIYINGAQVTSLSSATYPTQNTDCTLNASGMEINIGRFNLSGYYQYFDGYMAEVNFIDGQALTPSDFGNYNEDTGVWQPAKYIGSYGTNGFYLPFSDATNTTTLVADSSGQGNDWSPNNISLTAGVTYDSMTDTPTPYADGGNYATWNPLDVNLSLASISNGNLTASGTGSQWAVPTIQFPLSGNYYVEFTVSASTDTSAWTGIRMPSGSTYLIYLRNGQIQNQSGTLTTVSTYGASDVIGISANCLTGGVIFYKNGTQVYSGNTTVPSSVLIVYCSNTTWDANFGQRPFAYTPPTGFLPLHTGNLPDSTIVSGDDYFKTYLYTGNGGGLQVGEIQKPFTTYEVSNSLRLRSSATGYLSRTHTGTPTNAKKGTLSLWLKRGVLGAGTGNSQYLIESGTGASNDTHFNMNINTSDAISLGQYSWSGFTTTAVFRDPSAWYHFVLSYDSTLASNNVILYQNGAQIGITSVTQNTLWAILNTGQAINIGRHTSVGRTFDGYLAEVNLIDGQALDPSDFGDYDGNNYWVPKAYTGTYGTNGFYLDFSDTTSTATLVADQSGEGNDWTPNNISLTAGTTYDSMIDVPTLYADGGNGRGNYWTFDPLVPVTGATYSSGNLQYTSNTANKSGFAQPLPATGKWYWEGVWLTNGGGSNPIIGIAQAGFENTQGAAGELGIRTDGNSFDENASAATYGASWTIGDVIGVVVDMDAGTIGFYKNGVSQGTAFTTVLTALTQPVKPMFRVNAANDAFAINFGQRPFAYTPPTGFKALNSFNIAEVTDDLETPDLVWIKSRSATQSHTLFDSVRGVHNYLQSDNTALEATDVNSLLQFNKNGFLLGASAAVNTSGNTYAGWGWKAGTAFSNDAGTNGATIASVGSVNQDAGFSVVTYTGNSTSGATVAHSLGAEPKMVIVKARGTPNGIARSWFVYHGELGGTKFIYLDQASRDQTGSTVWNNTNPSSTVFTLGNENSVNQSTYDYVAYCFAEVPGYSSFGSYTGNGLSDGPFVYLGFRPAYVLIKSSTIATSWYQFDSVRETFNEVKFPLFPDTPATEATNTFGLDFVSNGFKLRAPTGYGLNNSGGTYIYMAFAENPFKNSLAR